MGWSLRGVVLGDRYLVRVLVILSLCLNSHGFEQWYRTFGNVATRLSECQRERRQQQHRLAALSEHTTDIIVHVEFDNGEVRFVDCNSRFAAAFGRTGDSVTPEFLAPLVAPAETEAERSELLDRLGRGEHAQRTVQVETVDGERAFDYQFVPIPDTGRPTEGFAIYSGQRDPTAELGRMKELRERSQQLANIGAWELDCGGSEPDALTWSDETYRIHELPVGEDIDTERALRFYHPDDRPRVRAALTAAIEDGQTYDLEVRLVTDRDNERWVRILGEPVRADGETRCVRGMIQDVTARKHDELRLQSLHVATQQLLQAESDRDICQLFVDIADKHIQADGVAIHLLDGDDYQFTPAATSPTFVELCGGVPPIPIGETDSPAWTAFVDGETVSIDDPAALPWTERDESDDELIYTSTRVNPTDVPVTATDSVRSGAFIPVGDIAIVSFLSTDETLDSRTLQLVETLVATTEAAFDRLESEASLRERDAQLKRRNERLNRQIQLTDISRRINQSLIDIDSRAEIETAVCERLADSDGIAFAWIGTRDSEDEVVRPTTTAGTGDQYLDAVSLGPEGNEPAWQTATTDSVTTVENIAAGLRSATAPWRRRCLEHGFQSIVSIPLCHDDYTYGVLTVYGTKSTSLGGLDATIFAELGRTIGKAITAAETRQALYGDSVTALTLRFSDAPSLLSRLSTATACRVQIEGVSPNDDGGSRLFFTASGVDPSDVTRYLDQQEAVDTHRLVRTTDDGGYFAAMVTDGLVAETLVSQGASLQSMNAEDGVLDVTVHLSTDTDVRGFLELLQRTYTDVELLNRRRVERSVGSEIDLVDSLLDSLTARQRETLTTAYYNGYFEWPRQSTGEEVATMLGVSQPTVNRHLRFAQSKLYSALFDRASDDP